LRRAPALAAAALVCAVTAVVLFVLAAQGAAEAIERRRTQGGSIETHVHDVEALTPLTVSLVTAAAALVLVPLARHHLDVWRERYTKSASGLTRTLTALAKGPAVTILVLAVLTGLTYIVGSGKW
jgi:hypothetical protein